MDAPLSRRRGLALAVAAGFALACVAVYLIAFHTTQGRVLDDATADGFRGLAGPVTEPLAERVAHVFDPLPFAAMTALVGLLALVRRRVRAAIVVPLAMIAANATTQILKALIGPPDGAPAAIFPSGHATAAASVVLGVVLVLAPRLRPFVAAAGGLLATAAAYSVVLLGWHLPSDAAAGFCVAGAWAALALAVLPAEHSRAATPVALRQVLWAPAAAALLACAAVGVLALERPEAAVDYARDNTTFVVVAAALGAAALALATVFAVLARRRSAPGAR